MTESHEWESWRIFILSELKRADANQKRIIAKLDYIQDEITSLKIKSAIWGSVAGSIITVLGLFAERMLRGH